MVDTKGIFLHRFRNSMGIGIFVFYLYNRDRKATGMVSVIIVCHECDMPHVKKPLKEGETARCVRCGAVLYMKRRNSLDRTLALTLTASVLFVVANAYPFLEMKIEGRLKETTLLTGVAELIGQQMYGLALLVLFTSVVVPFLEIFGYLYILAPLKFGRTPRGLATVFRWIKTLQPWGMMEVFMLGILVALVKLAKMAEIIPGLALYAFMALIFAIAAMKASLDHDMVWGRLGFDT
jgi:paraquat-inducible protein A